MKNIALQSLQIFSSSCYVRKLLHNKKICKLRKAIFPVFYNISPLNFGILLLLKGKKVFPGTSFFVWICLDQKLVYYANCPLFVTRSLKKYSLLCSVCAYKLLVYKLEFAT